MNRRAETGGRGSAVVMRQTRGGRDRASAPSSAASGRQPGSPSTGMRSSHSFQGPRIKIQEDTGEVKGLAYQILSLPCVREVNECQTPDDLEKKMIEILGLTESETELRDAATVDFYVAGLHWAKEQGFTNMQLSGFYTLMFTCLKNLEAKMTFEENWKELKKSFVGVTDTPSADEYGGAAPPPPDINTPISSHHPTTSLSHSGATPGSSTPGGMHGGGSGTPGGVTPGVTPVRVDTPPLLGPPSGGLDFFDTKQAAAIIEFLNVTFFQHHRLYEFAFHLPQEEPILHHFLKLNVPPEAGLPYPNPLEEAVQDDMYYSLLQTRPSTPPVEVMATSGGQEVLPAGVVAAQLVDNVKSLVHTTTKELFGEVENEVTYKLKERENQYINKINKIHRVSPSQTTGSS